MFYPVLLHRQGTLEDEVAEPEARGADEYHKIHEENPEDIICVTCMFVTWNFLIFFAFKAHKRVNELYLQVSLYISSGVCGKGSVFFFEPGLERGLTALQSKAGRGNVFQSFSTNLLTLPRLEESEQSTENGISNI